MDICNFSSWVAWGGRVEQAQNDCTSEWKEGFQFLSISYQDCKTHTWILNETNAVAVFIVRLHLGLKGLALPEQRNRLFTCRCEHCRHFANNKRRIVNLRWHVCPPVCATHNRTRRTAITAGHSQTWLSALSTSSSSSSVSSTLPSLVCLINKNWAFLFDDAWSSR